MSTHTEWVSARPEHRSFVEYRHYVDDYGTESDGKVLLIGTDSVVAIEGTHQELLGFITRMIQAIEEDVANLKQDWQYEVTNGDTALGFEEWLEHRHEAQRTDSA